MLNQHYHISINFVGTVIVAKDCWLVGDGFLNETFTSFMDLKTDAKDGKTQMPYLYDYYNIAFFSENPLSCNTNVLSNLLNSVIHGLNTKINPEQGNVQLPRFIVMIPEDDILKFINYFAYGISTLIGKCLNWLVTQVDCVIESRKDQLR